MSQQQPSLTLSAPEHWWARGLTSPPRRQRWELLQLWPTPQGPMAYLFGQMQPYPLRALLQEAEEWQPCPTPEGAALSADLCHHRAEHARCNFCRYEATARMVVLVLGNHPNGLSLTELHRMVGETEGKLAVALDRLRDERRVVLQGRSAKLTALGRLVLEAYRRDAERGQLGDARPDGVA